MAYCDWLTVKTGRKFRLPTDAEWEHAARAGQRGEPAERGWCRTNSGGRTRQPGTSKPNSWGLCDMLGNVWELVLEPREPGTLTPVYRGGAWDSAEAEAAFDVRQSVIPEWFEADPLRPRSLWWLMGSFNQGMRVVCVGDAASMKASAAYAPKIDVKILRNVEKRLVTKGDRFADFYRTVTVELRNGGDSVIEEMEVQVYFLDPSGAPHLQEVDGPSGPGRPTFTWIYPVMRSGVHPMAAKPMSPGESRVFNVDIPESMDGVNVDAKAFGARVTWARLKP